MKLGEEIGRKNLIAQAYLGLARAAEGSNNPEGSLESAYKAIALYTELKHRNWAVTRDLIERLGGKKPPFNCG